MCWGTWIGEAFSLTFSPQLEQRFAELAGRYPAGYRRAALVPMLLYAQDEVGSITPQLVAEIAGRLGLTTLQVDEVVSYYSMLWRRPKGRRHVQICTNISCMLAGGEALWQHAQERLHLRHKETSPNGEFSLEEVECIGACSWAPAMQINYDFYHQVTPEKFDEILKGAPPVQGSLQPYNEPHPAEVRVLTRRFGLQNSRSIDTYLAHDGYRAIEKALQQMTPEQIIEEVKASALRGRGGAGFPAGMKWGFVPRQSSKPKYIVVNADESEPGTCKDRLLMERDPHQLIEGALIAARAVDARTGYIYVRGEYRYLIEILDRAIAEAYERGYLGPNILGTGFHFDLYTHSGAGAYECGEESALLESLEGKRGIPRIRPPFPAVVGAFQCPTVLNNVETFCAVPSIVLNGGANFANLGTRKNGGTRLFCLSGHVNRPGVYELPMGFPLRRMIEEVGGGIRRGKKVKAVIPGGSSCPVLADHQLDLPMDFDSLQQAGSMLGSGGVVVMDEDTCMVKMAQRIMGFYAHESCGWCIPCREGTMWLRKLLTRFHAGGGSAADIALVGELAQNMLGKTFCPLGDAAALPTISIVKKFRQEFEAHLNGKGCPQSAG